MERNSQEIEGQILLHLIIDTIKYILFFKSKKTYSCILVHKKIQVKYIHVCL